jgi:eukaryotic-like serine/threonine-protein kinase
VPVSHGGSVEPAPFPERVGRYELLLPIASGGMATVYLGRTSGLGGFEREVALKLTHAHLREDSVFAVSLMDEANLAGRIRHPNVVSVLDVGEDPHGVYLVMEYVEGETLAGLMRLAEELDTRLPESVSLRIADDMLAGMHAAHELRDGSGSLVGLVHRDVTPHNVLVGVDGVAKLTDFGIAKAATRLGMTATGVIKGKVAYMSPEQALGRPLDRTCDIWAAGVVLWELLSGMRLHASTNDAATLLRIVSERPPALRSVRPAVPHELAEVVGRALEMDPRARHPTAEAFAHALERAARNSFGRAERRDVGEYVRELVQERLAKRRDKIGEILELRGRISRITHATLPLQLGTPSDLEPRSMIKGRRPGVIAEPDEPTVPDRASVPSSVTRSDAFAGSRSEPSLPRAPSGEATRTETISVATAAATGADKERRRGRRMLIAGVAVGTVVGAAVIGIVAKERPAPPHAAVSAVPSDSAAAPADPRDPEQRPLTPDELPLAEPAASAARKVTVTSSAPIATVFVGRRRVEFPEPAKEQIVTLAPDERAAWISVVSSDGRRGGARLDARSERINVALGTARVHRAGPEPEPVKLEAAPAAAPPPAASGGGLLNNPYRGKR